MECRETLDSAQVFVEQSIGESDRIFIPAITLSGFDATHQQHSLTDRVERIENPVRIASLLNAEFPHG